MYTLDKLCVKGNPNETPHPRNSCREGQNKILAVYPAWIKLSKFQPSGKQPNIGNKIREPKGIM